MIKANPKIKAVKVSDLFKVRSGDFHAVDELDPGEVPLVSCGDIGNGVIGYFEIPADLQYSHAITVAYNGSWPLTAKFHPYKFGTKDDVAVLIPKTKISESAVLYVAAILNMMTWRYSYGRKCFRKKLENLELPLPVRFGAVGPEIDEQFIQKKFGRDYRAYIPKAPAPMKAKLAELKWKAVPIAELFELRRGDFHSIANLDHGTEMTISRVTEDNGVVGYFDAPENAVKYDRGHITVSTVGGDAFVQLDSFIATDNVVVLIPLQDFKLTTVFFIAFMLNYQKWRYSYGRQCYITKLQRVKIYLPFKNGIDEDAIEKIVTASKYWNVVKGQFTSDVIAAEASAPTAQRALFPVTFPA